VKDSVPEQKVRGGDFNRIPKNTVGARNILFFRGGRGIEIYTSTEQR
jgi:hypothetical protein